MSDIHALSGAYAVDALDDIERASFERHLTGCSACRDEVAELREAAAMLSETTATEPPAGLRDRVLADATRVRPLPPETPAVVVERPRHRRRSMLLAAAAAVVALGAGAVVVSQQPWEGSPPTATQAVLDASDATSTTVDLSEGASATVTRSDSLGQAVIVTHDMPAPPEGKVYQLWLDQPDQGLVSAGLMPAGADQTVLLEGDAATAAGAGITVEPAGGSDAPTTEPIALFAFETPGT